MFAAEAADLAVPSGARKAAILHEGGRFGVPRNHLLELTERDVTHADPARVALVARVQHRLPDFNVGSGPSRRRRWTVQDEAVHVISAEMLERAGQRLRDLERKWRRRIVGKAMVLASERSELCLQEEISARDEAIAIRLCQCFSNAGFEVMPALVGRVDSAKAGSERQRGERRGAVLFPGRAVDEIRDRKMRRARLHDGELTGSGLACAASQASTTLRFESRRIEEDADALRLFPAHDAVDEDVRLTRETRIPARPVGRRSR